MVAHQQALQAVSRQVAKAASLQQGLGLIRAEGAEADGVGSLAFQHGAIL